MRIDGTFTTRDFKPGQTRCFPDIRTAMPTGVSTMEKLYSGQIDGHSATLFTAAFDPSTGRGAYVAMESFEGVLNDRHGTFNLYILPQRPERTGRMNSSRSSREVVPAL